MPLNSPWGDSWGESWGDTWQLANVNEKGLMPDLSETIREAIINTPAITALLGTFAGDPCVFTKRPTPAAAPYPIIIVSPDVAALEEDGLFHFQTTFTRDILIYVGNATAPDYRKADQIQALVRQLFHRQWRVINVVNWKVTDIVAINQTLTSQDDQVEGRVVTLNITVAQSRS